MAAVFWGTMSIFVNSLSAMGLTTVQIAMLRDFFSLIFITMLILFKERNLFKINIRDIWMFFGSGILSYFLFSVKHLPAGACALSEKSACFQTFRSDTLTQK